MHILLVSLHEKVFELGGDGPIGVVVVRLRLHLEHAAFRTIYGSLWYVVA